MILMRWLDRIIGVVSTIILARLLVPADFGVVAAASIAVALVDVFLNLGVSVALIHNRDATDDDFHTAWTIRLIQAVTAAAIVILCAPLAADYFHEPRLVDVIRLMAATMIIGGLGNIGVVQFQKNMEFGREFQLRFISRVARFFVTIAAAWLLRSYWALVWGSLIGRSMGAVISYIMCDFRPRLSIKKLRSIWSFSQWVLVRNVGAFIDQRIANTYVGRMFNSASLGAYTLADEIAALPSTELLAPIGRVLFPAFVEVRDSPSQLKRAFLLALAIQVTVAVPAGVGIALVAPELVPAMLGNKWLATIPIIKILALTNIIFALTTSTGYLLLALGRVRVNASFVWMRVFLFIALAMTLAPNTVAGAASLRLAVAIIGLGIFVFLILHQLPQLHLKDIFLAVWRPLIGTATMAGALLVLAAPSTWSVYALLAIKVGVGALVYIVSVFVLWRISGCPDGGESYILEKLRKAPLFRR